MMRTRMFSLWLMVFSISCNGGTVDSDDDDDDDDDDDNDSSGADAGEPCIDETCPSWPGPLGDGVATLAGWSEAGVADGPRGIARFDNPVNVVAAPDGDVFVADFNNHQIRRVTSDGEVTTLTAQPDFARPFGLALSADGETLYVQTDRNDRLEVGETRGTVWKVDVATGAATVIARDLGRPRGIAVAGDGRIVLVDHVSHTVRLMDPSSGAITNLAGAAGVAGAADGTGAAARFAQPYDVVVDRDGRILIADFGNHRIRAVTLSGAVSTFAGSGEPGWQDGAAAEARFDHPQALAVDEQGHVYVTDSNNYRVRRIGADGQVTTIAGDGSPGFRDGAPLEASMFGLEGLDTTADGGFLYIADGNRGEDGPYHRVRRLSNQ